MIRRVDSLVTPIETILFDVFNKGYLANWRVVMQKFEESVKLIEDDTKNFIDQSFDQLRSAEGAFDLLCNFKDIQSREAINRQMEQKFTNVLDRYSDEVDLIRNIFDEHVAKASPPCSKNQPPVAGAISWSRSLKRRIMKPIVRFQTMGEMKSEKGQQIMAKYIEVAKAMRDYEDTLFEEWKATVQLMTSEQMQSKLLREVAPDEDGASIEELMADTGGQPPEPKIVVNFNPGLLLTIRETKYLGQLDARFKIPQKAQNVFLQGEKYYKYVAEIKDMLENYNAAIDALTPAERTLLQANVDDLQGCLRPGFVTLNWNSLGITDFIDSCGKGINDFQSISSQVQKTAANIEQVVADIANAVLVVPPVAADDFVLETTEFAEALEKSRARTVEQLVSK